MLCVFYHLLSYFDIKYGIRTDCGFRPMVQSCVEFIVLACSYLTYINVEVSGKTGIQLILMV